MPLKFGKKARKDNAKTLLLSKYLGADAPPTPPQKVYYEYLVKSWPIYLNDTLGCCVFAAGGHMLQNWTAHGLTEISATDQDIESAYEAVGGYVPGNEATDNGAAITDFLAWWQKNPLTDAKTIAGWAGIDSTNLEHVKQAIYLFGGIDIGLQLPQSAMDQFGAGENWEVVPGSPNIGGHSVCVFGYGSQGCACITWGKVQYMSWDFFRQFCDEAYAIISTDFIKTATAETEFGLNLAALQADIKEIAA